MRAEARARAVAGLLALLLAALVAATFDGAGLPDGIPLPQRADTAEPEQTAEPGEEPAVPPGEAQPPRAGQPSLLPVWVRSAVRALILLALFGAVLALLLSVRFVILRRRLRGDAKLRSSPAVLATQEIEPDPDEVATALADSLAGLDAGSPRNAVVACWIRLEDLATSRGLPRQPADTPSEFVARALEAYALDASALERLADLYREARFSVHPLTEAHRAEARTCLERLAVGVRPRDGQGVVTT